MIMGRRGFGKVSGVAGRYRWLASLLGVALVVSPLILAASPDLAATPAAQAANWTQLSPVTSPSARWGASMAYDPATGQMVLFGGFVNNSTALADTWVWIGSNL